VPIRRSIATARVKVSISETRDIPQPTYNPLVRSISEKK
jgi:hypothetical protein